MDKTIQTQHQVHVLFELSPLDFREEVDERTQRTFQNLKQLIAGKALKECHEIYLKYIAANSLHNTEELTMGLLVAILADQEGQQARFYRDVVTVSKDSLTLFSTYLNIIIIERLTKLRDHSTKQIFWTAHQLMKANISTAENICSNLIRQTASGDLSPRNMRLVECLLDLLVENRTWIINSTSFMVPTIIYTFLRLILDHMGTAHSALRQKEVDFVIGLIREKFLDCMSIGRDLLRLLHYVNKLPEFEQLLNDIYNNPKSLHPTFQSPMQLLSNRTPRRLFQSRLTFEMERKIAFLATQVKFGNQKRYQDWFHKQYLATPESLSLRCDLIRYICSIIHPSNEVLCSDIIPRWAIIGWLLTTCTTSVSAANSKSALFFDWLVYDAKMDNIMNIEPAILVMYYSMKPHPNVTAGLLDFLCRIPSNFCPKFSEHIKAGLKKSLQQILEKRVVQSLSPLFDNPRHDATLRALLRDTFPEYCASPVHTDNGVSHPSPPVLNQPNHTAQVTPACNQTTVNNTKHTLDLINIDCDKSASSDESESAVVTNSNSTRPTTPQNTYHNSKPPDAESTRLVDKLDLGSPSNPFSRDDMKAFSWNGSESPSYSHKQNQDQKAKKQNLNSIQQTSNLPIKRFKSALEDDDSCESFNSIVRTSCDNMSNEPKMDSSRPDSGLRVIYPFMTVSDGNFEETVNNFDDPVKCILEDLNSERSREVRCSLMDKLISTVFDNSSDQNATTINDLGHCMAHIVVSDFTSRIFPSSSQDNESLEESINSPLFVLCRSAFSSIQTNWATKPMSLLVSIGKSLQATSFLILYFLRVASIVNGSKVASCYMEYCNAAERKLSNCLHDDLFMTLTYDSEMFCFLLPSVFGELASSGSFPVTGNINLIHLVVSAIDPISLQELISLCLTGGAKVISKDEVMPLIQSSLKWESWEQYCVWKLISAQSIPIDSYISILPKLDVKANAEAMSCIMLNLQKVFEPTTNMIQSLINCENKSSSLFISSILRYWSMKTDVEELAKLISSLCELKPISPPVKRKGQTKSVKVAPSLSPQNERILGHLESIRQKAPKSKLLAQLETTLSQLEALCDENQKKRFSEMFSNRPKASKKQKKTDKEVT